VVFADDGAQVAFSTSDGSIRTRDLTNERVRSIPFAAAGYMPLMLSFSPDKSHISAFYADGNFRVWNIETGTIACEFPNESDWVNIVAFSSHHPWIAIGSSTGTCFVYNYMEGHRISRITSISKGAIVQIIFTEDQGVELLTVDGRRYTMDVTSGNLNSTVVGKSFCGTFYVAFSPDGSRVASASALGQVTMWDSLTGHPIKRFISRGREAMVVVTFSWDSCQIGAGSSEGITRVWNINDQHVENIGEENSSDTITSVCVASGGNRIAVMRDYNELQLYDANNPSHPISVLP
jgi:WD40 repeat protein